MSLNLTLTEARELIIAAQRLINAIEPRGLVNLRDRAIVGVIGYAWAQLDPVLAMRVRDYYSLGGRRWVRLVENDTERHEIADRRLEQYIDDYLLAAQIENEPHTPLFRSTILASGHKLSRQLSRRPVRRHYILDLLRNRESKVAIIPLPEESLRELLDSIKTYGYSNLRDRAIIGLMLYASAPMHQISKMCLHDYYKSGGQNWIRLSAELSVMAATPLVALIDSYLTAARLEKDRSRPLFRVDRNCPMMSSDIHKMIKRRSRAMLNTSADSVPRSHG